MSKSQFRILNHAGSYTPVVHSSVVHSTYSVYDWRKKRMLYLEIVSETLQYSRLQYTTVAAMPFLLLLLLFFLLLSLSLSLSLSRACCDVFV